MYSREELTIKISNDDPNPDTKVVLWDITLTEVDTGQGYSTAFDHYFNNPTRQT